MSTVRTAESDEDIARCFAVMHQLRPHLNQDDFIPTIRRQTAGGYRLVFLEAEGQVLAAAGFRFIENLAGRRILYVDDLVTDDANRSQGRGAVLFDWLVAQARSAGCQYLELDSGVQRFDAHRFYLDHRMRISAHHFQLKL